MNAKPVAAATSSDRAVSLRRGLPILLALALGAAACGLKPAREAKPAAADPAFAFPHGTHVDADVACANCHPMEKATKLETGVRHVQLPAKPSKQKACADCHDTDPVLKVPARQRPFRQNFSHADHLPRVNGDCKRCHAAPPEAGDKEPKTPTMASCTGCHNHQQDFVEARCTPCHKDLKGYYSPQTAFQHEGDWLRAHGQLAHASAESCAACHDQTYCAECHSPQTAAGRPSIVFPERVDRSFIHRGDYVSRHMVEQGANPASCRRCHGSAFCQACHELQGLSKFVEGTRRPASHDQPNWATPAALGQIPRHGNEGRRDITSCAGCHDQGAAATCVGCHQVGGIASQNNPANPNGPHPASFISRHRGESKTDNSICAACHR
jgi:hypothetical protein